MSIGVGPGQGYVVAPVPAVEQPEPDLAIGKRGAVRLVVGGRPVVLAGIQQPPRGVTRYLVLLGPGVVAAMAGDDAGGIATYSSVGAKFGYELLWMMLLITLSLAVVQEMGARLGAATGRGMLDLVRERFGIAWALFAVGVVLLANGGVIVTEFVGIGAALEIFGLSRYLSVPVAAAAIWWLVIGGSYVRVEKVFILMTLAFFAYPLAAFMAGPNWGELARGHSSQHCGRTRSTCCSSWGRSARRSPPICSSSSRVASSRRAWLAVTTAPSGSTPTPERSSLT